MEKNKLDEILNEGIYGKKEILPDERNLFLGTIRERIYLALSNSQVRKKDIYKEVEQLIQRGDNKNIQLLINGSINYDAYSKYLHLATQYSVPFTIVHQRRKTPIGIVITSKKALHEERKFFIEDDDFYVDFPQ